MSQPTLENVAAVRPTDERLIALVDDLRSLPTETEWVEFKENAAQPERIGKTVAALSNSACVSGEPKAYLVWGIRDGDHEVVGTVFDPKLPLSGNEPFELWLAKSLSPSVAFRFLTAAHPKGRVVVLEIPAASSVPVKYGAVAYIRVGNTTPKLSDFPEREADLVSKLKPFAWEHSTAAAFLTEQDVVEGLEIDAYFELMKVERPGTTPAVLERLRDERVIGRDVGGRWSISNLGAILFSRKLDNFDDLARKALRVVQYDGETRLRSKRLQEFMRGYASGFQSALEFIDGLLPAEEVIHQGIRIRRRTFPEIALRELVANALIHQDMTISGTGPIVEIFDNRIEISNPGVPVTDMLRKLFGAPPRSRNEHMGRLMRRMGCQTARNRDPLSAPKRDPLSGAERRGA